MFVPTTSTQPLSKSPTPKATSVVDVDSDNDSREKDYQSDTKGIGDLDEDDSPIPYLAVASGSSSRRQSTTEAVIERLQVEKIDGGTLTISGVVLGANCHLTLLIFGSFFLVAGIVLTYMGFAFDETNVEPSPAPDDNAVAQSATDAKVAGQDGAKNSSQGQMKIIGPIFVTGGIIMLILGWAIFLISRQINQDEKDHRLLMSAVQLGEMERSFNQTRDSPVHTISVPSLNSQGPVLSLRRGSWWIEPTPVESPSPGEEGEVPPPSFRRNSLSSSPLPDRSERRSLQMSCPAPFPPQCQASAAAPLQPCHATCSFPLSQHSPSPPPTAPLHPKQPLQQSSETRRLSRVASPLVRTYYGDKEGVQDIATFPTDVECNTSGHLRVQIAPCESSSFNPTSGRKKLDKSVSFEDDIKARQDKQVAENADVLPRITVSSVRNL